MIDRCTRSRASSTQKRRVLRGQREQFSRCSSAAVLNHRASGEHVSTCGNHGHYEANAAQSHSRGGGVPVAYRSQSAARLGKTWWRLLRVEGFERDAAGGRPRRHTQLRGVTEDTTTRAPRGIGMASGRHRIVKLRTGETRGSRSIGGNALATTAGSHKRVRNSM